MHEGACGRVVEGDGNVSDAEIAQQEELTRDRVANLILDGLECRAFPLQPAPHGAGVETEPFGNFLHARLPDQQKRTEQMADMPGHFPPRPLQIVEETGKGTAMQAAVGLRQPVVQRRRPEQQACLALAEADRTAAETPIWGRIVRQRARNEDLLRAERSLGQLGDEIAPHGQNHVVNLVRDPDRQIVDAISKKDIPVGPNEIDCATG